jgi:hypothetical protein
VRFHVVDKFAAGIEFFRSGHPNLIVYPGGA